VLVDILDYRIMRAVAAYYALSPHSSPLSDPETEPSGSTESELLENEPCVKMR